MTHAKPRASIALLVAVLAGIAALVLLSGPLNARSIAPAPAAQTSCPDGGFNPTPTQLAVTAAPIVVTSTSDDYFVLYAQHDLDASTTVDLPVLVKLGETGTTTLAETVEALPTERYRVEKFAVDEPADVDGDCVDDLTDTNPVNSAPAIDLVDGAVAIPDEQTLGSLAFKDREHLYLKFIIYDLDTSRPGVHFINAATWPHHADFLEAQGEERGGLIHGQIVYDPGLEAPDGSMGVYYYFHGIGDYSFSKADRIHTAIASSLRLIENNLALNLRNDWLHHIQAELSLFRESRIPLIFEADLTAQTPYLALNEGVGFGRLRVMAADERPHPRDVVIYEALPNELPRVAGIISTVPQTPLSHINLRAVQNNIPNAFIRNATGKTDIADLVGGYVRYRVSEDGYTIRAATRAEVDAHYASSRPAEAQTPERDLTVTEITPLSEIGFEDWTAFGVKAANVAELGTLGFAAGSIPEGGTVPTGGTVPDGFAAPFYFYDEFMKANDLYTDVTAMLADTDFQTDFDTQEEMLDELRDNIKDGTTPGWIITALEEMHAAFPEGQSLRYRSSTNNEDLPGFNGAGLYDSKTQDPDETGEDGIDKSIKGVWASLWNFRAFTERDFHRIDHMASAMGVLVHPNYSDELANGVAVSFDPVSGKDGTYYVNTQVDEDLVTNPDALSSPEEILLNGPGSYTILALSNQVERGQLLMTNEQLEQLRGHLAVIHDHFEGLYNPASGEPFAMEIEFKRTAEDVLAIKQARPWVFGNAEGSPSPTPPPTTTTTTGTGGGGGGGGGFGPAPVAPKFGDGFRTTRSVAENAGPGDGVGEPVSAVHPDDLWITYSLSGTDASMFAVDEETGQIRVKEGVALALGRSYTVNLTATDSAGFGAIIIVMIEVTEASFSPYDMNGNDRIERNEVIMAVSDYFKGLIAKDEVIALIKLYFSG